MAVEVCAGWTNLCEFSFFFPSPFPLLRYRVPLPSFTRRSSLATRCTTPSTTPPLDRAPVYKREVSPQGKSNCHGPVQKPKMHISRNPQDETGQDARITTVLYLWTPLILPRTPVRVPVENFRFQATIPSAEKEIQIRSLILKLLIQSTELYKIVEIFTDEEVANHLNFNRTN